MLRRKKKSQEEIDKNKAHIQKRNNFFLSIWSERKHFCENCDKFLGHEPKTYHFDHILEKGKEKYSHLEFEKDNIMLLCFSCHEKKTNGFYSELIQNKINNLKIKYNL